MCFWKDEDTEAAADSDDQQQDLVFLFSEFSVRFLSGGKKAGV